MDDTWSESVGWALPEVSDTLPGPAGTALVDLLARHESPGIMARRARQGEARGLSKDPIVWAKAAGGNVWDADGNRYVDLTAGFGVATIGHTHPAVVRAITRQAERLLHGMGDVFPNDQRIRLMAALAKRAPEGLTQCILAGGGAEAVEAALKTAALASGRPGVLAFSGGYHGLSYGALVATAYKADFRLPFAGQLGPHARHLPYGCDPGLVEAFVRGPASGGEQIGAILVEPIQGRGGEVVPPEGWLVALREICDRYQLVLVFDEVYTGFGRTGAWWAGEHAGVVPDVMAVGKSLAGGMPIGACLARPEVMKAWGQSVGEAIHTSTFLGNPVVAAAALATLEVMEAMNVPARAREFEAHARRFFAPTGLVLRGRGGMLGLELAASGPGSAARVMGQMLKRGYLVLPSGIFGDILGLTPPLMLSEAQREGAFAAILEAVGGGPS
jgi:4-aminobutyrate aminotransferase-like enzyme